MDETVWFLGESGALMTMARSQMTRDVLDRFKAGTLRQVNPDGSPWAGRAFWLPPPPPPLPEETTIDTLRGYRYWSVRTGRLVSRGLFRWRPGEWAEAECPQCPVVPSQEACMEYGYGCGLYAASTPDEAIRHEVWPSIWGVIEAKGRIVSHAYGFRAQYARVIALAMPQRASGYEKAAHYVHSIAGAYAVPLLPAGVLVTEYAPDQ